MTNIKSKQYATGSLTSGVLFPKKSLRENKSVRNIVGGPSSHQGSTQGPSVPQSSSMNKEHKRSMTLATRDGITNGHGKVFQSIIEEPAEEIPRSIDAKSKEGSRQNKQWTSQIPRVAQRKQSRGQS